MTWSDWLTGDLGPTASGPFGSNLVSRDYVNRGVPVIRGQNMTSRWVDGEFAFVSEDKAKQLRASIATPGDLVFTQRGTLGQVAVVPDEPYERYVLSQSQMKLSPDPAKVDALFLYYLFSSPEQQEYVRRNATQSGVPHTNLAFLRSTPISLPSVEEQQAIARVLGALDDKIELNRRMNETLDALARAEFERATRAGGRAATLREHVDVIRGRSYKSIELKPSTTALVTLKSFARGGGYRSDGLKPYSGEFAEAQLIAPGELVLACTDVTQAAEIIGRPALVLGDPRYENLVASLDLVIVRPRSPLNVAFLYFLLGQADFAEHAYAHTTGTTVLHLDRNCIANYEFMLPPADSLAAFDRVAQPLLDRISSNHKEARTLAELRDALLPKLISGELRVREVSGAGQSSEH